MLKLVTLERRNRLINAADVADERLLDGDVLLIVQCLARTRTWDRDRRLQDRRVGFRRRNGVDSVVASEAVAALAGSGAGRVAGSLAALSGGDVDRRQGNGAVRVALRARVILRQHDRNGGLALADKVVREARAGQEKAETLLGGIAAGETARLHSQCQAGIIEQMIAVRIGEGTQRVRHGAGRNCVGPDGVRRVLRRNQACAEGAPMAKALIAITASVEPIELPLSLLFRRTPPRAMSRPPLDRGSTSPSFHPTRQRAKPGVISKIISKIFRAVQFRMNLNLPHVRTALSAISGAHHGAKAAGRRPCVSSVQQDQITGEIGGMKPERDLDFADRRHGILRAEHAIHAPSAEARIEEIDMTMVVAAERLRRPRQAACRRRTVCPAAMRSHARY